MPSLPSAITSFDPALIVPVAVCVGLPVWFIVSRMQASAAKAKLLREKGIGRGAPGFLTGSRKVALPVHIVARIKMGEDVSPEEITEAIEEERKRLEEVERLDRERFEKERREAEIRIRGGSTSGTSTPTRRKQQDEPKPLTPSASVDTEWLPQGTLASGGKGSNKKKRK